MSLRDFTPKQRIRSGWLYRGGPPLPIPNREVKPRRADGTTVTGGRVGRRQNIDHSKHLALGSI